MKDTRAAPLDWAPATFLMAGWTLSTGPGCPVTKQIPEDHPLGLIKRVPGPSGRRVPVDIAVQGAEDQVAAGEDVLQMLRQSGVFPGCLGSQERKKAVTARAAGSLHPPAAARVEICWLQSTPAFAGACPCCRSPADNRRCRRGSWRPLPPFVSQARGGEDLRRGNHLLSPRLFRLNVKHLLQRAVFPRAARIGHLHRRPAGASIFPACSSTR